MEYRFLKVGRNFSKIIPILNNQFKFFITINIDGDINYKVIDTLSIDEYVLVKFPTAQGTFVENMRNICRDILIEISEKYFVVLMKIEWKKLNISNKGNVEIINIKVPPEEVKKLIEREDIYPAYHMNKKHWVSVCLNRTVLDSEVFNLIVKSYECSGKR